MNSPTKKQEETLREFLHEAVVPLIEDVLVKKLGQAMSYAKEQLATPKQWVGLTDENVIDKCIEAGFERNSLGWSFTYGRLDYHLLKFAKAIEAALKEKNNV